MAGYVIKSHVSGLEILTYAWIVRCQGDLIQVTAVLTFVGSTVGEDFQGMDPVDELFLHSGPELYDPSVVIG